VAIKKKKHKCYMLIYDWMICSEGWENGEKEVVKWRKDLWKGCGKS
jgi:hypothetical protein